MPLRLDQIQQLLRRPGILLHLHIRIDRLEIVIPRFDLLDRDRPAAFAVGPRGQQFQEVGKMLQGERRLLAHLDIRQIIVPDLFGLRSLGEEKDVRFHPSPGIDKGPRRQTDDRPQITLLQQLALGLDKGRFVGTEQHPFIEHDPAPAALQQAVDDVLEKEHLGSTGFVGEADLSILALFAAEGRIREDDIEGGRCIQKEPAIDFLAGQGIAVPEIGLIDAVEHQVGQGDGIDHMIFLPPVEGPLFERLQLVGRRPLAQPFVHKVMGLGQKAAGSASRIVYSLPDLRRQGLDHGADHFAGREELPAVIVLVAQAEQQSFIDLGESKNMGIVDRGRTNGMDPIQHIEKVAFGIHPGPLHAGQDLADDFLPGRGVGPITQPLEIGQQLAVDETEEGSRRAVLQLAALPADGAGLSRFGLIRRRCPIVPAIRGFQRGNEFRSYSRSLFGFLDLSLIEDAQEEDPCQFGDVLQSAGAIGAPQNVADRPDSRIDRLLRGQFFTVSVVFGTAWHLEFSVEGSPQDGCGKPVDSIELIKNLIL